MEEISKKTGKTKQNRGYIEKKKHFSCMIKKKAVPLHPQWQKIELSAQLYRRKVV